MGNNGHSQRPPMGMVEIATVAAKATEVKQRLGL